MDQSDNSESVVRGRVKWFDPSKGFGFVVADGGGPDILLHANVLRNFGQSSVADGSAIQVSVQRTPRGVQAFAVHEITPPEPVEDDEAEDHSSFAAGLEGGPLQPARVKWFDKSKGFGFANVFGNREDVFVHIEVLRRSSLAELQPGEAVALSVADGERGRLAVQVATWEAGLEAGE